jgi:cell division protein FtsB
MSELSFSSATSSPSRHITVLDVYDLASSIKLDLEQIVRQYGQQCVQDLACKVVSALETLEALAKNNERTNSEVTELKTTIERLESERTLRSRDKEHFEKEMMEFEESIKRENQELWEMVKTLESENKLLKSKISSMAEQTVEEKEKEG